MTAILATNSAAAAPTPPRMTPPVDPVGSSPGQVGGMQPGPARVLPGAVAIADTTFAINYQARAWSNLFAGPRQGGRTVTFDSLDSALMTARMMSAGEHAGLGVFELANGGGFELRQMRTPDIQQFGQDQSTAARAPWHAVRHDSWGFGQTAGRVRFIDPSLAAIVDDEYEVRQQGR